MNDSGVVVGTSFTGPADHGFAWGNGTWIDLWATSPDRWSGSRGVNDSGVIVGWGVGDTGQVVGCKWTTGAQAELLPNLAGIYGSAEDIDQSGRITGWSMDGQDMDRPCICNTDGTIQGLDVLLGSSWGRGFHMNNVGQVVGYCGGSYPYRATVWNADGSMVELKHDGWNYIEATGINDAGQVVGYALDQSGQEHGFIYTPETGVVDLSLVGASGFTASSINNDGVIAGSCRLPDRMQACLLVPVPEPSSLFAVLSLLAPFCVAAVRRAR